MGVVGIPASLQALRVPVASLTPYGRNPRRGNLEAIKASLLAHGQYRPLVVRSGTREVLAGNHTLAAAVELGWEEIAVTEVDVDDQEAARIVLVDNRTGDLGTYDEEALAQLLGSLPDLDGTAWQPLELDRLLAELERSAEEATRDTDPGPPPAKPRTRPGDVWQLGEHRLICGDATDPKVTGRLLTGAAPTLLTTDPPYGIELDMEWRDRAGRNKLTPAERSYMKSLKGRARTAGPASISGDTVGDWSAAYEHVPSLAVAYVWHASTRTSEVEAGLLRVGFELMQQIIWVKTVFVLSRQHYHWQHEPCWYAKRKGSKVRWLGGYSQATVWQAASPKQIMSGANEEREDHPTQKPLELFVRPIQNHLRPGDGVYDPFAGSGTAVLAAENTRTVCHACEIDPAYCDVIVDRWERHTGGKATPRG